MGSMMATDQLSVGRIRLLGLKILIFFDQNSLYKLNMHACKNKVFASDCATACENAGGPTPHLRKPILTACNIFFSVSRFLLNLQGEIVILTESATARTSDIVPNIGRLALRCRSTALLCFTSPSIRTSSHALLSYLLLYYCMLCYWYARKLVMPSFACSPSLPHSLSFVFTFSQALNYFFSKIHIQFIIRLYYYILRNKISHD